MEKSVCIFAAVIFMGVLLDKAGALRINATTESSSLVPTTTVKWSESVTVEDHRHRHTPTAQTELFTTAVPRKQLDTKNTSNKKDKDAEEADGKKTDHKKTQLGKEKWSLWTSEPLPSRLVVLNCSPGVERSQRDVRLIKTKRCCSSAMRRSQSYFCCRNL